MTEPTNPLFDDEKEFLERKKLEYERALRGEVDHIKDQSVVIGKVALAGAGVAGGIWLLSKAFGGKKKRKHRPDPSHDGFQHYTQHHSDWDGDHRHSDDEEGSDVGFQEYYTDGLGNRHKSKFVPKSARASAQAFMDDEDNFSDDFAPADYDRRDPAADKYAAHSLPFVEDDPFRDRPYDDSRRMPDSREFADDDDMADYDTDRPAVPRRNMVGEVLKSFLQSDTGKVIVAQAAAVVLALVTKKVSEVFPNLTGDATAKNADLATAMANPAMPAGGFSPAAAPDFRSETAPDAPHSAPSAS